MGSSDDMDKAAKLFFSSPRFAVAGASSDPRKFGNRSKYTTNTMSSDQSTHCLAVFAWYLTHGITPTPLNPGNPSVTVMDEEYATKPSPSKLEHPTETSLSVITAPPITMKLLKEAKEVGVKAVWLQPGTFDDEVMRYAKSAFPGAVVGGNGGGGSEGWCVLVDGEWAMKEAGRAGGRL